MRDQLDAAVTEVAERASSKTLTRLVMAMGEKGVGERDDRLYLAGLVVKRTITSSKDLTQDEASAVIRHVQSATAERMRTALDNRPDPLAGAIICTRAIATMLPPARTADGYAPPPGRPLTPEEVEVQAQAAVDRFRARNGAIPDPPAREEIPPRVPVPYEPGGRSCAPARCYCKGCPGYVPLPPLRTAAAVALADYRR